MKQSSNLVVCARLLQLYLTLCEPVDCSPPGSSVLVNFPGKNTGVGSHALLYRIFLTQGTNPCPVCLLHWLMGSLPLVLPGKTLYLHGKLDWYIVLVYSYLRYEKWKCWSLSHVQLFATPWTVPAGSTVHWILQARILEWVAISFSRDSSWRRGWTWVSCIAGRFFTIWATREAHILRYNAK